MRRPRSIATTAAVVLLVLAGAACSSSGGSSAASTTAADGSTTVTTAGSTTVPTTATSTAPPTTAATTVPATTTAPTTTATTAAPTTTGPSGAPTPEAAAQALYAAWKAGDKAKAATVADPAAVNTIFERSYTGPDLQFMGCQPDGVVYACGYYYEGGARSFRVKGSAPAGYRVFAINDLAD